MTTTDWIAAAGVGIQLLLFAGLMWYCFETRRIRFASESQLEALHTPCMTFAATPRDAVDAVIGMDDARGAMILDFDYGDAMPKNIGNGPAVNISYALMPLDHRNIVRPDGYVSFVPSSTRCCVPISRNTLANHDFDCVIQYESLSQTRYTSRLTVRNLVLTHPFQFEKTVRGGK